MGKMLSSSWCYLKIYTADKNFTRPPVAQVAPNINSAKNEMNNKKYEIRLKKLEIR